MAFQPVPGTAGVRIIQSFDDASFGPVELMNTLYYRKVPATWSQAELATLADQVRDAWVATMLPLQAEELTLVKVTATDLTQQFGGTAEVVSVLAGGNTLPPISTANAMMVTFVGTPGEPPKRGRVFIGGLTEGDIDGNGWNAAARTAVAAAMTTVTEAGEASLATSHVIVSRWQGGVKRPQAVTSTVTALGTRELVAVQKDRRT